MTGTAAAALRQKLHALAEPSGQEKQTAAALASFLESHGLPVETGIGGHGILVKLGKPPYRLLRADMDALPIEGGAAHRCGHDGHMAMLATALTTMEPTRGIVALFQPSEEDGAGMARCLADPQLDLDISDAFAIHNLPGAPRGAICINSGALASTGVRISLRGEAAHAASPHTGRSPWPALRKLTEAIPGLADGHPGALATLIHVRLGQENYGTSPGCGVVAATLRGSDEAVAAMRANWLSLVPADFEATIDDVDPFPETRNTEAANAAAAAACQKAGVPVEHLDGPHAWSEDVGHAINRWGGALVGLGTGDVPALHDPGYTFPDDVLDAGVRFWEALA